MIKFILLVIMVFTSSFASAKNGKWGELLPGSVAPILPAGRLISPSEYDRIRKEHIQRAKTLDEFLAWATPEELMQEFGFEQLISHAEPRRWDRPVKINVNLENSTVEMVSPETGYVQGPIGKGKSGSGGRYLTEQYAGCFEPTFISEHYRSRTYPKPTGGAPMPNSVFFGPGVALHAGDVTGRSHGCVRLTKAMSRQVFEAVRKHGTINTQICICTGICESIQN